MQWSLVSDHFQYGASTGLIAVVSAALAQQTEHLPLEQRYTLGGSLLAILALLCWWQAALWVDATTIWRDNVTKNPRSWTGYANLAAALAHDGKHEEAAAELERALAIKPDYVAAHIHLGIIQAALQKPQDAIRHFEAALAIEPTRADAENNLGTLLMTQGRVGEAQQHFIKALQNNPGYADAWRHLAIVAVRLGNRDEAINFLQEALRLRPDFAAAKADLETLTRNKP
jgi:Tfp pilus assembly protein PilF